MSLKVYDKTALVTECPQCHCEYMYKYEGGTEDTVFSGKGDSVWHKYVQPSFKEKIKRA